jgi:hypothetical protein
LAGNDVVYGCPRCYPFAFGSKIYSKKPLLTSIKQGKPQFLKEKKPCILLLKLVAWFSGFFNTMNLL